MGSFGKKSKFSNERILTPEEVEAYKNSEGVKYVTSLSETAMIELKEVNPNADKAEFMMFMSSYLSVEMVKLYEEVVVLRKYKEMYDRIASPISKEVQEAMDSTEYPIDTGSYITGGV